MKWYVREEDLQETFVTALSLSRKYINCNEKVQMYLDIKWKCLIKRMSM